MQCCPSPDEQRILHPIISDQTDKTGVTKMVTPVSYPLEPGIAASMRIPRSGRPMERLFILFRFNASGEGSSSLPASGDRAVIQAGESLQSFFAFSEGFHVLFHAGVLKEATVILPGRGGVCDEALHG